MDGEKVTAAREAVIELRERDKLGNDLVLAQAHRVIDVADTIISALEAAGKPDEVRRAATNLAHWARQYIMAIEREFGPQPKYGNGLVGSLNSAIEETNQALASAARGEKGEGSKA